MSTSPRRASARRRAALAVTLAACVATALAPVSVAAGPGEAHHPRSVHVRGDQILVKTTDTVTEYAMEGDLVGEWLLKPVGPPLYKSKTFYSDAGIESFTGCIDRNRNGKCGKRDRRGTMNTTYIYWASFESDGTTLIKGQCTHPITGGTGAFKGARGVLNMYDRLVGDEVKTTYRGNIVLNAVPEEGGVPPVVTAPKTTAKTLAQSSGGSLRQGC